MTIMELIAPYGGRLIDLTTAPEDRESLKRYATSLPAIQLSERTLCDLEILASGGFSPLDRFLGETDYYRSMEAMRLGSGALFPVPVTLTVEPNPALRLDRDIALRNARNELIGVMTVEEIYPWNPEEFAFHVCGTTDSSHPLVAELSRWGRYNLSGPLKILDLPRHHDFPGLRLTPAQTRAALRRFGRSTVVAFQTRNPLLRAHEEMIRRTVQAMDGTLLLHPAVGMTQPGDVDHYTRVRTYISTIQRGYPGDRALLALLPLAMRLAGPREALWHAIISRNYGASHLILGRDHASPGRDSADQPFYQPYAAQNLVEAHAEEIGVQIIPYKELVYLPDQERYVEIDRAPSGARRFSLSGARLRRDFLDTGAPIPEWFVRPEVADILRETFPPRHRQGVCVWFTGLSGAGKSTTAEALTVLLEAHGRRSTLLDGDVVRTHLSKGLGFSREDRNTNIRRIGFVASEIVRHGGVAICAAVSPYRLIRDEARGMIGSDRFIEVFVNTPLDICELRDAKGMYARARRGEITGFTGIDDPYEPPAHPEITLDTTRRSVEENAGAILNYLIEKGFVRRQSEDGATAQFSGASQ